MRTIKVVYWQEQGLWRGCLKEYPGQVVTGRTREETRSRLKSLYHELVGRPRNAEDQMLVAGQPVVPVAVIM